VQGLGKLAEDDDRNVREGM